MDGLIDRVDQLFTSALARELWCWLFVLPPGFGAIVDCFEKRVKRFSICLGASSNWRRKSFGSVAKASVAMAVSR